MVAAFEPRPPLLQLMMGHTQFLIHHLRRQECRHLKNVTFLKRHFVNKQFKMFGYFCYLKKSQQNHKSFALACEPGLSAILSSNT